MKTLRFALLAVALGVTAPLTASAQSVVVDDSFAGGTFRWSDRGSMYFRWRPVLNDGQIFICGVRANNASSNRTSRLNSAALRDAKIVLNDQRVMQGLDFFATANSAHVAQKLVGQTSNCRATSLAANTDIGALRLEFRKGRYRP